MPKIVRHKMFKIRYLIWIGYSWANMVLTNEEFKPIGFYSEEGVNWGKEGAVRCGTGGKR